MQAFLPVLLVIHIIACVALVIAVMLQRSEGGALGMGGGGTGGLISGRGVANVLVRTTMALAAVFFATSVLMARLNTEAARAPSAVQKELENRKSNAFETPKAPAAPAPATPDATNAPASPLTPVPTAPTTTAPAAPVLDPLAVPSTAPAKPTTTPAAPDTKPAVPPPSDSNG